MSAGQLQRSRESSVRLTRPAGATSTPSMITVATETPSGMDRNITDMLGMYCQGVLIHIAFKIMWRLKQFIAVFLNPT
jgi:hypothetical protein